MKMARLLVLTLASLVVAANGRLAMSADDTLTLATTTSTDNSGLLAFIHPDFEAKTGIKVKVVAKGTGASLQLARDGNADVILVHARQQEDQFVTEGYGVMRRDVMYNDFVIIGPKDDPAAIEQTRQPSKALGRIADSRQQFISRGDNSGTHIREQQLWRGAGVPLETETISVFVKNEKKSFESIRPAGSWYLSIGQGMGKTIMLATEKRAYTLADRGTYFSFALATPAKTNLVILSENHASLHNPYGVIAVNPKQHPQVNFEGARKYIEWITSKDVQHKIGQFQFQGKTLFHPGVSVAEED